MKTNCLKHTLNAGLLCSILFFAGASPVFSQEASLLWKIEGNGLAQPSWLFGTQHLMCGEDFTIPEAALDRLNASDALALEIDLSDSGVKQELMQLPRLPDGQSIAAYINSDEKADIEAFLVSHFGAGLDHFANARPIWLTVMAIPAIVACEQQMLSHDVHLMHEAMKHGTDITGLESVEFQFSLFDAIPLEQQVAELVALVQDPNDARAEFSRMSRLYLDQDIDGLYSAVVADEFWQEHRELLLDTRNRAWVAVMEEMSAVRSVLYAVGAGHLAGDNGLIRLLRDAGYTLSPVSANL